MTGMNLDATMTPLHWAILGGIVALCVTGTVGLVALSRWLDRKGEEHDAAESFEVSFIAECADVAAMEHTLPDFRLTYQPERNAA